MQFAFYCKFRGILEDSSYLEGVAVQRYRTNSGKKLIGTGLVVVVQAYYPLCCGSACSSIDKKEKKILSTLWS